MADLVSAPGREEIGLYDLMRKGGVTARNAANGFLNAHGINRLPDKSNPIIAPSARVDGRIFIDFNTPQAADIARQGLLRNRIDAVVHTGQGIPQNGSSLYFDGSHFKEYMQKNYPDFTQDQKTFDKVFGAPLKKIIDGNKAIPGGGLINMRAQNLLEAAAAIKPPLDKAKIASAAAFLDEASQLLDRREYPKEYIDHVANIGRPVRELVTKLEDLQKLGTAPRGEETQTRFNTRYIDANGKTIAIQGEHKVGLAGPNMGSRSHVDLTLSAAEAVPGFNTAQKAEYESYVEKFTANGIDYDHIKDFKNGTGTLGQFLGELTNPRSPMAVALKEATKGKENPVEEASNLERPFRDIYERAIKDYPDEKKSQIREAWSQRGEPWLALQASVADRLLNAADLIDKKTPETAMPGVARKLINDNVGPKALERSYEEPSQQTPQAQPQRGGPRPD